VALVVLAAELLKLLLAPLPVALDQFWWAVAIAVLVLPVLCMLLLVLVHQ
jgi:hypothetical protein